MNDCSNQLEHEKQLVKLASQQAQHSKRFDTLELNLEDLHQKIEKIDERTQRTEIEQAKQAEQLNHMASSIEDIKSTLEKKAPMPTGVTASIIAAVISGIFMLGATYFFRLFGGN